MHFIFSSIGTGLFLRADIGGGFFEGEDQDGNAFAEEYEDERSGPAVLFGGGMDSLFGGWRRGFSSISIMH